MFHLIGLRQDGKLALYDSYHEPLTTEEIERICKAFNYTQVLIFGDDEGQLERYEYDTEPRLRQVPISIFSD